MIDPDTLFFSSEKYRVLLDEIGVSISGEDAEERKGNSIGASEHGLKVWGHLQELMKMLRAKSVFELDHGGATIYDLLYWASAFADELHNASLKDESFVSKKLEFCETYVAMHSDLLNRDVRNLGNVRISLADSYFRTGKARKADALFRKWLSAEPEWGWGWIGWSDCYWLWELPSLEKDFGKADRILKEGLSVPNVSDMNYLAERCSELQEKTCSIRAPQGNSVDLICRRLILDTKKNKYRKNTENEGARSSQEEPAWLDPANDRKTPYTEEEINSFVDGAISNMGDVEEWKTLVEQVGERKAREILKEGFKRMDERSLHNMEIVGPAH